MKVLYLHGINNEGASSKDVRDAWSKHLNDAFNFGIKGDQAFAPYYGDALAGAPRLITRQRRRQNGNWLRLKHLRNQWQQNSNIGLQAWFNLILGDVEAVTDFGTVGLRVLDQARHYFYNPFTRDGILARAVDGLQSHQPDVVIAHSLGSVVAIEAIRAANVQVERLITIGSPLGLKVVLEHVVEPHKKPNAVGRWVNVINPNDQVTLNRSLRKHWGGRLIDNRDAAWLAQSHALKKYLKVPAVGREIRGLIA